MLRTALRGIVKRGYFWSKTPKKTLIQEMQQATESAPNVGHLIKSMLEQNAKKPRLLPAKKDDKLTVVMQIDQVLVYTFTPDQQGYLLAPMRPYDWYHQMEDYDALMSIYKRRNLDNFLNYLIEQCEPVIFTCGVPRYAELIMGLIDPQKRIKHIFTQQHCDNIIVEDDNIDEFLKDLNRLNRDMRRVVYLDSKPLSYWMHPDNCIPLEEFRADQTMKSQDLNLLIPEIQRLRKQKDVRTILSEKFKLREILEESKLL